jgi:hypothetical protein
MIRNEAGLQVLESGDEVRIGNGKVLYNVLIHGAESVTIVSQNTHRKQAVSAERLTLVRNVRDLFPEAFEPVDTDDANEEEAPVVETSAYAKAVLFALNKLQKHVYAGTVSRQTKTKRRALGRRQKASRKANR